LFYVDDLQWADAATLWLLAHVLRQLADARVLVVASYRESELDRTHPLAKALVEWNRERLTTRLALKRLGPEGTRAQLAALLGEDPGAELAAALHQETDGNPFFVEEILKALIEQGSVARKAQGWVHCDVGDLQLPQSVKAAIGRRLDRVSPETNDVLRAAAVLGKQFGFAELAEAAGETSEDALLNALDEAVAAQLLVTGRHDTFAFTHDKIREVLYEELNPIRRRRLHLRTAEGLERCRDRAAVSVDRLAHHFIEAGAHERGLVYARQAAVEARRVFAYDEALAACARAYECAEALGRADEQLALQQEMGQLCRVAGNAVAALEHFERALALATDPVTRARLQCDAATSLVVNGDPRGLEYVQHARAVLDPARHPIETANALVVEGRFHHLAGRHSVAANRLLEAVALLERRVAETADDEAITALVLACTYLGGACQHLGLFDDGDRWARKAIEVGVTYGRPSAEAIGYEMLSENACISGRWHESLALVTTGRAIGERLHSRERLAWSYLPTALSYLNLGDPMRAEQEFESGIALALAVGERRLAVMLQASRPIAVADRGRLDEALPLATEAVEAADRVGLVFLQTEARRGMAHVHGTRGDWDAAISMYDDVLRLVGEGEPAVSRLLMGASHVRALQAAGRSDDARAELARFEQLASRCQSPVAVRQVAELKAELAGS
jgi:tetratricopeptide (TPR) repeat protein